MSITIKQISISNFRSCENLLVELNRYTALVGYNNCGKSNVLAGISWLLRRHSLPAGDFWDVEQPVVVSGTFVGIDDHDLALLSERPRAQISAFIFDGTLQMRRTQLRPDARATDIEFEVFDTARGEWRSNPTGIDNALNVLLPEPIRIGAMEDAEEDATKAKTSTTIGKLLGEFTAPIQQAHAQELNQHLVEVSRRISSTGDVRIAELAVIDEGINDKLQSTFPGMSVRLHFEVPDVGSLIKSGTLRVQEDGREEREFGSYGHGAQRAIQMTLVRHLAEIRRGNRLAGTTLLLIDEPELYLHPHAIEQIRVALKQLSERGYQVVFSTHSAQLIQAEDAQHVVLVRKQADGKTAVRRRLRDAIDVVVPDAQHQTEHLFSLSNSTHLLFADSVLVVEGKTERKLLPSIYQAHKRKSLGQVGVALIPLDGATNLGKTLQILKALDLPAKAVVDLDYAFTRAISDGFLDAADADIAALKAILARLKQGGRISIDARSQLPTKGVQGRAEKAYMLLAAEPDAAAAIERLHTKLSAAGIWMWTLGAVEAHLGLAAKNEATWAAFKKRMDEQTFPVACGNDTKAVELTEWITT